jgi:hypothetical protein
MIRPPQLGPRATLDSLALGDLRYAFYHLSLFSQRSASPHRAPCPCKREPLYGREEHHGLCPLAGQGHLPAEETAYPGVNAIRKGEGVVLLEVIEGKALR